MYIQFVATILGWFGIVAGGTKVALATKAAVATKAATTTVAVTNLYQSIPSYTVYEWMWNIGSIGYGVGGVYEGYKVAKNVPDSVPDPVQ